MLTVECEPAAGCAGAGDSRFRPVKGDRMNQTRRAMLFALIFALLFGVSVDARARGAGIE